MTGEGKGRESPAKSPGFFEKLFSSKSNSPHKRNGDRLFEFRSDGGSSKGSSAGLANYNPPNEQTETPFEDPTCRSTSSSASRRESGSNGEGEDQPRNRFEDAMRDVLRKLDVEVEDEDDWKQMVVKTRLYLKDFKNNFTGEGKTKEERTAKLNIPLGTENMLEIQFRLDFAHYTPPPSETPLEEDDLTVQPDMTGLETPVGKEPIRSKKKRLKRILRAIKKSEKLNKKRQSRLAEEAKHEEELNEEPQNEDGVGEDEEDADNRTFIEKIEDGTGIKIHVDTEKLEQRWEEYRDIFFGPELTEEEKEQLRRLKDNNKEFYIHLKFIVRKKTAEEKAQDEEEEEKEGEGEEEEEKADEDVSLDEIDERKQEKRYNLEQKNASSESEEGSGSDGIPYIS